MVREPLTLTASDGVKLEAELVIPDGDLIGAAVLTHPHPRHGGNMRSMVPGELIQALPKLGIATLRFNFRGMGASEGSFSDGVGEKLDTTAAIDVISEVTEGLPLVLCGSSFGADTALTVADSRISGWCALAPPLREHRLPEMTDVGASSKPKHLVIAERDQFRLPPSVLEVTAAWNATTLTVIPGADHFFVGRLDKAISSCTAFVQELIE